MHILIAEDEMTSLRVLQSMLERWGHTVESVRDGRQAWDVLQGEDAPNVAILDWMMPELDGLEVCRRVRQQPPQTGRYTYVILLTGRDERQDVVRGLAAGADDYITKPFDTGELQVRLKAAGRILDLESRLLAVQEALTHEATHDSLTGLMNRPAILSTLEKELNRAQRTGSSVGVILGDLDRFKRVNDVYGHAAGDAVLRTVAKALRSNVRPYDAVGRYGGEEFLVVLPGCGPAAAPKRAERLRVAIEQLCIEVPDAMLEATVSLGVACSDAAGDTATPDALIRQADGALYEAKDQGRNCVLTAGVDICPVLELEN